MGDLSSLTFDRIGRRRPDRSTVRLLCPKSQRTLAWRSCWFWHPMWCRRRRPRKRPRGLERVPGARRCRIHHPTAPGRIPPVKTRRRKKRPLPLQRGEGRKGRPPQLGRLKGPRRGRPFLRTTPPTPTTTKRSGRPGPSPWRNRKYPDTGVIHSIRLLHSFPLCRNMFMQSAQGRARRVVERLPGFIGREFSSARCLPLCCG